MIVIITSAFISIIICYAFSFYYSYLYSEIAKRNNKEIIEWVIKNGVIDSNHYDHKQLK